MRCEHCRRLLDEYVEGLLLPLDRASVEAHLGTCERCTVQTAQLAGLIHALRDLPDTDVTDDFTESVMSRLPERLPAQEGAGHIARWGLVAAATLLAFVAGLAALPQLGGPEVARETLAPLSASLQLGGTALAHAASALASVLDASASVLVSAGVGSKLVFAILFLLSNCALATAVHRYRDAWLHQLACVHLD